MIERMARHGFVDRPAATVAEAAALTVALQAQDLGSARLGVRSRASAPTDTDVRAALDDGRTVVRTWLMRNTIHLVSARDVRWLAAVFGPMIQRRFASKRWPELGLSPDVLDRVATAAPSVLAAGPLSRHDFVAALRDHGIAIEPIGQAPVHVLLYLATIGVTCHASADRFALLSDWLPDAPAGTRGDNALAELARRWFAAYSPATGVDFATWSGLPSAHAIALIRDDLTPVEVNGRKGFRLKAPTSPSGGGLRLLGGFDNYLLGYRDRDPIMAAAARHEVYVRGIIRPTVLHDGRVIGRWRLNRPASPTKPVDVQIRLFERANPVVREAIAAEVHDIGRFIDRATTISRLDP